MSNIFEIIDKTGRKIRLTKRQWIHIITKHPDLFEKEEKIKETLEKPEIILMHKFDRNTRNYCKYDKNEKAYLLVAVRYLNGEGFVITSFYTRKIKKHEQ
jgi:hypothetical protein